MLVSCNKPNMDHDAKAKTAAKLKPSTAVKIVEPATQKKRAVKLYSKPPSMRKAPTPRKSPAPKKGLGASGVLLAQGQVPWRLWVAYKTLKAMAGPKRRKSI